jgi:hypothetical protein
MSGGLIGLIGDRPRLSDYLSGEYIRPLLGFGPLRYNHAMYLVDKLAEEKISEAIKHGELDNLSGAGKPLQLEDDSLIPEALRAGFRLLKNSGYLPPSLDLRREIGSVETLLVQARSLEERDVLNRRLRYLLLQLSVASPDTPLLIEQQYLDKINRGQTTISQS